MTCIRRCVALLTSLTAIAAPASAQVVANLGGPFSRDAVLNAPFSAIATTTVREVHPDGVGLIRFGGHLPYEGYDVQTDGRHSKAARQAPVH